jgi:tetratricopeptide (TPR) repeat protein
MPSRKLLTVLPLVLIVASCSRDPRAQAQSAVDNGNKFFSKGRYREATLMYRRALQKDLKFGEAYYRLGLTDLKLSAYGDASHMLRRAVELQPNNTDAMTKLADLFLLAAYSDPGHAAQLVKEAQELANKLVKMDPKSYDGHRIMAQMALLGGKPADAVKEFEIADAAKPNTPELVTMYFEALVRNNQFPEAETLARGMMDQHKTYAPVYNALYVQYMRRNKPEEAEKILRAKVDNNPKHANYVLELAQHYYLTNHRPQMDAMIQQLGDEKAYPDGHLLAGDFFFFRVREFDHAEDQYQAGMKAFPKDKVVYQKRLVELFANQTAKNSEANSMLAAILKENPKDSDAIAMRAALMLQTGNPEQINMAANDLQTLVTKNPKNHLLHFNLARALAAKGQIDAARLQLEEAVKLRPDFIVAREMLGRIYLLKGDYGKGLQASEQILGLDRNSLTAHLMRSSALLGLGDRDKARDELTYITKTYPQNPDARWQVGFIAYQEKDFKQAEQIFSDLYKNNPRDGRSLAGLTEVLASEHRMTEAIAEAQKAVDKEPQRRDLRVFLANLEMRAEKYDDALGIYQGLLSKEPKSADLLYRIGETERRKGDLNGAIDSFRKCSQEAPNNTDCLRLLGLLMEATGKRELAKPVYEQILKIHPDDALALNNLAFAKAEEGVDLDQALSMAQRAVQAAPNSPELKDTLGWIYIKKSIPDDAIRIFRDLVVAEPKNAIFHYHYGMALTQKGDRAGAKKELELALQLKPSRDDEQKIRELLQKMAS